MEFYDIEEYVVQLGLQNERNAVEEFLKKQELSLDKDVQYTVAIIYMGNIIGTGSFSGRILKCIAVEKTYQGLGIANKIVSHLISEQYTRGITHSFIYTKPENYVLFNDLGFYKIAEVPGKVVLLENNPKGIKSYIDELGKRKADGRVISSIVVNCNPFTLGHRYIIEKASSESDVLHVFVVWEDKSSFPAEVRYDLVCEGTKHLSNVAVHKGRDYIISDATFPSYFIKEYSDVVRTHAMLDIEIFGTYIKSALGINRRYVGQEPYCMVTNTYNSIMKEILPKYGVEVVEIPRLKEGDNPISASKVRQLIREGNIEAVKNLVPGTTYEFLTSDNAKNIIKAIQRQVSRH